ncbi:hypothetical protein [Chamaesiphon sp. GL140_3_metabinner_50]|uniref:hypothetical protein n=1 Tax=Chamaesiphon sp. GL140_3_metabinner_50 TaxID=2970812 RepID=UPI0025E5DA35|nr:hypothetical protein [Chamaesiphon sp. GL140_3_metabinner_50]
MLDRLIDRMGDSNPQIFRELKERLTLRNIGIAVAGALVIQILVLLYFNGQIPVPILSDVTNESTPKELYRQAYSKYCYFNEIRNGYSPGEICTIDGGGSFKINWQTWRSDVFICLSWILPLGLFLGSIYTLVADLVQEEKRGTLNFIRLSPQSAQKIFIGKILGVPILVYVAAALIVPLHVWMGLSAQADILTLASWYATLGGLWFLLASTSILYVLLGGVQAIVTVIAVAFPLCAPIAMINAFMAATVNNEQWLKDNYLISWFGLPIGSSATYLYIFTTGSCLIASYGIWQILDRRYFNPTATVIGKYQSYSIDFCLQLWIAGFTVPFIFSANTHHYTIRQTIGVFGIFDFMALLLLIPMLLPSKQALQDWSRYRRDRTQQRRKFIQQDLVQDLIGNDKSPAIVTIAINVGMAMIVWIPVSIFALTAHTQGMDFNVFSTPGYVTRLVGGICVAASLILLYTAIAHLGLFLKVRKRNLWIFAIVGVAAILPVVVAYVLSPVGTPTGFAAVVLLFSPFAPMGLFQLAGTTILAAFTVQVAMFAALTYQLKRQLQISGRSQSKELLAQS